MCDLSLTTERKRRLREIHTAVNDIQSRKTNTKTKSKIMSHGSKKNRDISCESCVYTFLNQRHLEVYFTSH